MATNTSRFHDCIVRTRTDANRNVTVAIFDDKRVHGRRLKWWDGYHEYQGNDKELFFKRLDEEVRKEFGRLVKATRIKKDQNKYSGGNCISYCLYLHNS